jgi:hypothetical protein
VNSTWSSILVALVTSGLAAGIGAIAARRVNKADAADKLIAGAVRLVELVQDDNTALHTLVSELRDEVEKCEVKHRRLTTYLRDQGIALPSDI